MECCGPDSERERQILVVVPAFNEEATLPAVLRELRSSIPHLDILVVDDGSTDATAMVTKSQGVLVAQLPFNLGVGGALQTGFRYAVRHGYGGVVQFDADGQHDPSQIADLLAGLRQGADLVIGSRFLDGDCGYRVGRVRRAAMQLLRLAVRLLSGRDFSDTSSGFRAISAPLVRFYARTYPTDYLGDTAEALVMACQSGFRVIEVPVTMRIRAGGVPSTQSVELVYHYARALVSLTLRAQLDRGRRTLAVGGVPQDGDPVSTGRGTRSDAPPGDQRDNPTARPGPPSGDHDARRQVTER